MRKIYFIIIAVLISFIVESILFRFFGNWLKPNLLILLIVFFNLHHGVRYALFTSIVAGLLKDSFSAAPFGIYLSSFVFSAYFMVLLRRYFFGVEFTLSRALMACSTILINAVIVCILQMMFRVISVREALIFVVVPEIVTTMAIASFVLRKLEKCVLKFSV